MKTYFLALSLACVGTAMAQRNDWTIVPGKRVGPLTAETDRAALGRMFGESNIRDDPHFDQGEGDFAQAAIVFPNNPSAKLVVLPHSRVYVCGGFGRCKWHTASGITIGTGVTGLEALNGKPFLISNWLWDAGGLIWSWDHGKLASELGDHDSDNYSLSLVLNYAMDPRKGLKGLSPQKQRALGRIDQSPFPSSNDPAIRVLQLVVTGMIIDFSGKN